MKRFLLSNALVAAVVWTGGCGGQSEGKPSAKPDAGSVPDAGNVPDAGSVPDAGDAGAKPGRIDDAGAEPPVCRDAGVGTPGDGGEGLSCDLAATPCGGDVVGTWKVTNCPLELTGQVDVRGFGLGCSFGETISGSLEVSGTWTADATGLFWDNTTTKGVHEFSMPEACFQVGILTSCASLGRPFTNTLYATAECVDDPATGGCLCTGTFDQQGGVATISAGPSRMGRYSVAGNRLTLGGEQYGTRYDYCVMGDAMVLTLPAASAAGEVVGSIVLQKQ